MADPVLPPSRFGAGYTVGPPTATGAASAAPPAALGNPVASPADPARDTSAPANAGMNLLAVVAFVLSLLWGPFLVVLTIPMALHARRQIARRHQGGGGLALAALALGAVYLVVGVVAVVLALCTQGPIGTGLR